MDLVVLPRILHHIWTGGPVPDHLAAYRETWARLHPDWTMRLWTDDDLAAASWLINRDLLDRAETITEHVGQFRADVARYEILARYGGVYVDYDFEARRPIDPLCGVPCWAAWETDDVWINTAIIGAVPHHPLFAELIRRLPGNVERFRRRPRVRPNVLSGPQFFTPVAQAQGIEVRPSAEFYPYRWDELDRADDDFPDAYAIHHWDNQRKLKGRPRG